MDPLPPLTPAETRRYGRHLVLPEVGVLGQRRLKAGSVALVGAGGLGAPAGLYLAAAGVGRLGVVDFDTVEVSNLQRQVLYGTRDIGAAKVASAEGRLRDLNPEIEVIAHPVQLTPKNALEVLRGYDVVVDGTDNFPTRYLVNDACALLGVPYVYGSIFRFEGQASVFWKGRGPCYRCLHPEAPPPGEVPSCAEGGVLGVLPGVIGAVQAVEALKLLLGIGDTLIGRLLLFDALGLRFREMVLRRDPSCALCGDHPSITELGAATGTGEGSPFSCEAVDRGASQEKGEPSPTPVVVPALSAMQLRDRLARGTPPILLDVRMPEEWEICRLEGATLIPLPTLSRRLSELPRDAEIVVYCHHGIRSAAARDVLRRAGYSRVTHLAGGIDAWSHDVDPAVPRY